MATKLMLITPCFGFGGLERVVLSIVKEIDRRKYDPSFCTLLPPAPGMLEKMQELEVPCHILDKGAGVNYFLPIALRNLLLREKIQIVNSHDIGATLYAAVAAQLAGVPAVVHTEHSQILTKTRHLGIYGWVLNRLVSYSISVSSDLERYLVETFGLPPKNVRTIPNGIDVSRFIFSHDVSYLREELNLRDCDTVIGTIGRLTTQKGIDTLLAAFQLLQATRSNVRLVVVGEGELRNSLTKLAERLGIQEKVVFTGIRKDIPNLLHLFDVFVLSSLWEGQPIAIMEAMAAARPIVATAVGGNAEILKDGDYGLIVPPSDPAAMAKAIEALISDPELARAIAEKASAYARTHLDDRIMVRNYESVFSTLMP
jgi:glycosyltransferase involved in cell wall biosynthesis